MNTLWTGTICLLRMYSQNYFLNVISECKIKSEIHSISTFNIIQLQLRYISSILHISLNLCCSNIIQIGNECSHERSMIGHDIYLSMHGLIQFILHGNVFELSFRSLQSTGAIQVSNQYGPKSMNVHIIRNGQTNFKKVLYSAEIG